MFACKKCIKPEGRWYFKIALLSRGPCEGCHEVTSCVDIDSSLVSPATPATSNSTSDNCLHDWGWGLDGTCPNCGANRPKSQETSAEKQMPTTDDIRLAWAVYHDRRETREERQNTALWETMRDDAYADFDRWLAEHDRQTAERAWDQGWIADTEDFMDNPYGPQSPDLPTTERQS